MLEFDRSFGPALKQTPETKVAFRFVDRQAGQLVAKHREIVADGGLDLLARPVVISHFS